MSDLDIQLKVTYTVGLGLRGFDGERVIKALKELKDNVITFNNESEESEEIVTEWILSNFKEEDAFEVEYEIESLIIDEEEIF